MARPFSLPVAIALAVGGIAAAGARAAEPVVPPAAVDSGDEIIVYGRALPQIGLATSGSQGTVGYRDFEDKPLGRVGELVENVPGVIATQHSGTGKANQYFLRGFNLDHGTDFAGFYDGMPVNMRTHGHGQGYLDLNFLIPELVERIDYRKGPYFADVGDFSAAGTVRFTTVDQLAQPLIEVTAGSFGYGRLLFAGSRAAGGDGDLLVGIDGSLSDGPWVLDEKLRKLNALVKYSRGAADHRWGIGLSAYHARWNATDQVPQRAIDEGLISRFGNIDPFLGGTTTRIGLTANARFDRLQITLFALYYRFRLTSNFTYFLDDPVNGDEFQQRDQRGVFGGSVRRDFTATAFGRPITLAVGGDARLDHIGKIGLYHSVQGQRTATVREDKVDEASASLYAEADAALTDRLRLILGLRGDLYGYSVDARTLPVNSGKGRDAIVGPKAALAWRATDHLELYADYGESFHSNDVRGATIAVDPSTGDPATRVPVLVKARGLEVGARFEHRDLSLSLVGFYLALGSELVFSGDAGTTEPNAATRRLGTEANLFWRPTAWLTLDGAAGLTRARFHDVARGESRIPNSVETVFAGGAAVKLSHGASASIRLRHFGAAPLIEDGTVRSRPTTLVNLGLYGRVGRVHLDLALLNLFDVRDADISYYYASRLAGEPAAGVDDYHFHPVEPRQLRLTARYLF